MNTIERTALGEYLSDWNDSKPFNELITQLEHDDYFDDITIYQPFEDYHGSHVASLIMDKKRELERKRQSLASQFMEVQNHSIYRAYHTAVEIDGIQKVTSPNGIINFIFKDGSIVQTDIGLNFIGELVLND